MKTVRKQRKLTRKTVADRDDLWIIDHFSELIAKYAGKYVAVANETVAAVGDTPSEVEAEAKRKSPEKTPSVIHVPREEELACLL